MIGSVAVLPGVVGMSAVVVGLTAAATLVPAVVTVRAVTRSRGAAAA